MITDAKGRGTHMRKTFKLDKRNGKLFGVCAGVAEYTGIDAAVIRILLVVATLLGAAPWTFIAYAVAAWAAKPARHDEPVLPRSSTYAMREELSDLDRRMAEIDSYVASQDSRLAREIEQLR